MKLLKSSVGTSPVGGPRPMPALEIRLNRFLTGRFRPIIIRAYRQSYYILTRDPALPYTRVFVIAAVLRVSWTRVLFKRVSRLAPNHPC